MNTSPSNLLHIFVLLAMAVAAPAQAAELKPGESFPALEGFELEGTLPDLKDKIVLVDFWASWCAPCRASFPALNGLHERYGARGVVIVAVNVDEKRADMEKFLRNVPAKFAVVRDAKHKLVAAVNVAAMPSSFILGRDGRLRFTHHGFKGAETLKQYEQELNSLLEHP